MRAWQEKTWRYFARLHFLMCSLYQWEHTHIYQTLLWMLSVQQVESCDVNYSFSASCETLCLHMGKTMPGDIRWLLLSLTLLPHRCSIYHNVTLHTVWEAAPSFLYRFLVTKWGFQKCVDCCAQSSCTPASTRHRVEAISPMRFPTRLNFRLNVEENHLFST